MSKITRSIWSGLEVSASQECDIVKRKRGAPRKNGSRHDWTLLRAMLIIEGFQKFRMDGYNRARSQEKAVYHVKSFFPKMPVSVGTVKRVLACCHSEEYTKGCWVVERKLEEVPVWEDMTLGAVIDKFEIMEVLEFSLRPFPKYPKIKPTTLNFSKKCR